MQHDDTDLQFSVSDQFQMERSISLSNANIFCISDDIAYCLINWLDWFGKLFFYYWPA